MRMKEYSRSVLPRMHQSSGQEAPVVPRTSEKLSDGREIIFWGEPDMPVVLIRKGTKATLGSSGKPLADGAYRLEDGSALSVRGGEVEYFDRKYIGLKEIVVAAIIGLAFVFLLTCLANGAS